MIADMKFKKILYICHEQFLILYHNIRFIYKSGSCLQLLITYYNKRIMKTSLKIWMIAFLGILLMGPTALADNEKPITVDNLPTVARQLISKNFSGKKVALAKMESGILDKNYDVIFTNGDKLEFDKKGAWTEINCKRSAVPSALVPSAIKNYVKQNYSSNKIVKIERDGRKYEVELSNGMEITFNNKFQVIDIDD